MMKTGYLFVFTLLFLPGTMAYGQTKCNGSKEKAVLDIRKGKINFLVQGGIVSRYVKGQELFERKYQLKYLDFGCVIPKDLCLDVYNAEIAKYLDKKYGSSWRKEVRKDIMGI